jgi:trk system potassium uptake protein TrkA
MKIVVVGLGKVGRALTQQLSADKHDIVVIDRNPTIVDDICNICDVRGVTGNGGCYEVQAEAFEGGADLLIAATDSDEINILACLVAKKLNTRHTIARIRNPEYEKQLRFMRQELGLSMVINPEKATAREIARVLRFPNALKLEQFSKQRFELVEYRLTEGNPLTGLQLSDLYSNMRVKMLICAVARGKQITIPTGSFTLEEGDTIYLMATPQELEQFFRRLGIFKERANNVMVVGASRMAYYLVKELSEMNMHVTVIDNNPARCQDMSEKIPRALIIQGDGTDSELLAEEGIADMDAFVALTGLDETNIILAMYASQLNHCKVVAKINRKSFADVVTERGLVDSLVSTGADRTVCARHAEQPGYQCAHPAPSGRRQGGSAGIRRYRRCAVCRCTAAGPEPAQKYPCGGHYPRKRQDDYPVRQRFFLCRGRCDHCYHQHRSDRSARYYGKGVTE